MKELQAIVRALTARGAGDSVLATLATVEGSSYRRPGARLLVNQMERAPGIRSRVAPNWPLDATRFES